MTRESISLTEELDEAAQLDENIQHLEGFIEKQNQITGALFEKAAAYSNLIIGAGYAGFFGLWQLTKDYLDKRQSIWAAMLLLVSLIVFVLYEVYKQYASSRYLFDLGRTLRDENRSLKEKLLELERFELAQNKRSVKFAVSWYFALIVTLVSGLAAYGVLLYAFIRALLAG